MDLIQHRKITHGAVNAFEMDLSYVEIRRDSPKNQYDSHVHAECEIYINLTGDVSFMVEKRIYPILPGSIIVTRPYEYHHCIYHSNDLHKHFWILFSSEGNERLLPRFFDRNVGEDNLLTLSSDRQGELIALCHEMLAPDSNEASVQYRFFKLLQLLEQATPSLPDTAHYPNDLTAALELIDRAYAQPIAILELARAVHVSINTLERHFDEYLHMTPSAYLKKKRLSIAAEQLYHGASVSEACHNSGFSDYSDFIALFKKSYGITPLKYKKHTAKK